jgi:hypothetical protein
MVWLLTLEVQANPMPLAGADLISFVSRSDDLWSPQVSRDSISSAIAEYVGESDREGVLSPPYFLDPAADLA